MAARSPSTRSGQSLAERYRAHGEAFVLALELGCTPREAEAEIRRRQARLRWLGAEQRRQRKAKAPLLPPVRDERAISEPWMMRD